jgi:hypothetical protein
MFNFSLYPYARWLFDRSQGDAPGFNVDESEVPPGDGAAAGGTLAAPPMPQYPSWPRTLGSTLRLQNPLRSAPPSDPPGLWVTPANSVPGFRLNPQDESTSFNLNETDGSPREGTWPDGMPPDAAPPEGRDVAQTWPLPPGVEDPAQPVPSGIPDWLYKLVTTPLPPLSTAVDPQTGRRIVPYGPLVNPVRSYQGTDQNVPTAGNVPTYVGGINSSPDLRSVEARRAEQWPFSHTSDRPADTNVRTGAANAQNIDPQSAAREATWNNRPQPLTVGQPYAQVNGGKLQDPLSVGIARQAPSVPPTLSVRPVADPNLTLANSGDADVQQPQQQGLPPQNKQTHQQIPASSPGTGRPDTPAALRTPEKPGTEMTAAERQPDQELSQFVEECRRAAADLTQELARVATRFGTRVYEDTILKIGSDLALFAERFADDPGETADNLLASFPQTRVEGEFFAGFAAVFTILANAVRGGEFERAVLKALEAKKNKTKITVEGVGRSIPDILDKGITEIKSGVEIDSSPQLRTLSAYARKNRVPFNAVVGPATRRVSKTVQELVSDTGGTIKRFDPATGSIKPFK